MPFAKGESQSFSNCSKSAAGKAGAAASRRLHRAPVCATLDFGKSRTHTRESRASRPIPNRKGAGIHDKKARCRSGVAYVIHHSGPFQPSYEEDILEDRDDIIGHYRVSQ